MNDSQGSAAMVSNKSSDMNAKTGPVVCRNRVEVEREWSRLWLLDQLQHYYFVKSQLDKGLAEISSDPSLEEEQVRQVGHIILVHTEYWKSMKSFAEVAEREFQKKLGEEPLDIIRADRVAGAMHALGWFLSGENNRLADFLAFTVDNARRG
jgi:hypothetical protein